MINKELMERIYPQLKLNLNQDEWIYIPDMFSECYRTFEGEMEIITVKPPMSERVTPGHMNLTLQFYAINGACCGVDDWERIKKVGELL